MNENSFRTIRRSSLGASGVANDDNGPGDASFSSGNLPGFGVGFYAGALFTACAAALVWGWLR
jgi:hypothetical protein